MSKKAVYSNKGLAVYITGEDFEEMLEHRYLSVPLYIGKVQVEHSQIIVNTLSRANLALKDILALEQSAIDEARQKFPGADVRMVYKGKQSNRS